MIKAVFNKNINVQLSSEEFSDFHVESINIDEKSVSLRVNGIKYHCRILKKYPEDNTYFIKVNGKLIALEKKYHYDDAVSKISKYTKSDQKVNQLLSPMPGLILEIQTTVGSEVKKDDPLMILEAMKMENVLCSPVDGIIEEIVVSPKQTVEKNSVLIKFKA
jgi:biotin carboxyl carrier protein